MLGKNDTAVESLQLGAQAVESRTQKGDLLPSHELDNLTDDGRPARIQLLSVVAVGFY